MAWRFPVRLPAASMETTKRNNTSIDQAPYEAFYLMHILESPIDGQKSDFARELYQAMI